MTQAPGSSVRLPMNPLTGDVMTVFARLMFELVEPRLRLRVLRLRQVELRDGRLVPGVGVVEGLLRNQLALEQVPRAIEIGLRQPQVGLALPDGRRRHVERRLAPA